MKPISSQIAEALAEVFAGISISNGCHTDLGASVHRGFYAYVLQSEDTVLPAVILHPPTEDPTTVRKNDAAVEALFPVVIAATLGQGLAAFEEVEACLADVRRALVLAKPALAELVGRDDIELGVAEPDISRDSSLAMYAMSVSVKYTEVYQAG